MQCFSPLHLAVIGATGAVGGEVIRLLERRNFPIRRLDCYASERSLGKKVVFRKEEHPVKLLSEDHLEAVDLAIFCAGRTISKRYAKTWASRGTVVIDNSSLFRQDPDVPLVIPEINAHALRAHKGIIANPNCCTAIMLLPLAPLHRKFGIKRIVVATYQAASGAGAMGMRELELETKAYLEQKPYQREVFPFPYAFNLFIHPSPCDETGYVEEELKMINETRKILEDNSIAITATCVRVPVLRVHCEALNVEFHRPVSKAQAYEILREAPGVAIVEDPAHSRFAMPIDAAGKECILCSRIREDVSQPNTLEFWVVGDQLLKGAALNSVQIAETLFSQREAEDLLRD